MKHHLCTVSDTSEKYLLCVLERVIFETPIVLNGDSYFQHDLRQYYHKQIQDGNFLRRVCPEHYGEALLAAETLTVELSKGLEGEMLHRDVDTECAGESYVLAFSEIEQAVWFCTRLQTSMLKIAWPQQILLYAACKPTSDIAVELHDGEIEDEEYHQQLIWNGLRARCAIHKGTLTADLCSGTVLQRCIRILSATSGGDIYLSTRATQVYREKRQTPEGWADIDLRYDSELELEVVMQPLKPMKQGDVWRITHRLLKGRQGMMLNPEGRFENVRKIIRQNQKIGDASPAQSVSDTSSSTTNADNWKAATAALTRGIRHNTLTDEERGMYEALQGRLIAQVSKMYSSQYRLRSYIESSERQNMFYHDTFKAEPVDQLPNLGLTKKVRSAVYSSFRNTATKSSRHPNTDCPDESLLSLADVPGVPKLSQFRAYVKNLKSQIHGTQESTNNYRVAPLHKIHTLVKCFCASISGQLGNAEETADQALTNIIKKASDTNTIRGSVQSNVQSYTKAILTDEEKLPMNSSALSDSISGYLIQLFSTVRDSVKGSAPPPRKKTLPIVRKKKSISISNVSGIENRQRVLKQKWQQRRNSDSKDEQKDEHEVDEEPELTENTETVEKSASPQRRLTPISRPRSTIGSVSRRPSLTSVSSRPRSSLQPLPSRGSKSSMT